MVGPNGHYRAFISYSQRDKDWGKRIHTWLETYRVPAGVVPGQPQAQRLGRFFRDEEDMAAAADIGEVVRKAIANAESLIVVCSPRAAQSKWVNAEIQHYRRTGRGGRVFAVIVDGVPNSGDPATECFPAALRAAGDPDDPDAMPIEPLGLDVRKDGLTRACARLAAGLLGVDFDDLWQRDRRRAEARQRLLIGGLAGVSAVFAALAAAAVWFGFEADRNATEARARRIEAEDARMALQREYLGALGETAIEEVLDWDNVPGEILATDADWITVMELDGRDFAIARDYVRGRVFAVAHDGVLNGVDTPRSEGFLRRSVQWLAGPGGNRPVVIASGHCEWLPTRTPDWMLPDLLGAWGYPVRELPGPISDDQLSDAGLLVIGNAWGDITDAEVAAIERFVARGGGLLAAGLGWSWVQTGAHPDHVCTGQTEGQDTGNIDTYPMNRVAMPFGMQWTEAFFSDTSMSDGVWPDETGPDGPTRP